METTFAGNLPPLFAAMVKAQAAISNPKKDGVNPQFSKGNKPNYVTLASVTEAVLPHMTANGLAVWQSPSFDGQVVTVQTVVTHTEGGMMMSALAIKPAKIDAQGIGSAITYARRYALMSIIGIAPEDDDGNAASLVSFDQAPVATLTTGQRAEIEALLTEAGQDRAKFLAYCRVGAVEMIPQASFEALCAMLRKKIDKPVDKAGE